MDTQIIRDAITKLWETNESSIKSFIDELCKCYQYRFVKDGNNYHLFLQEEKDKSEFRVLDFEILRKEAQDEK